MRLGRRQGWLLVAVGVWNLLTYATFTKNLWSAHASGEDRPTGYWVAHSVLIVVNVVIGVVLGRLGLRALREDRGAARDA